MRIFLFITLVVATLALWGCDDPSSRGSFGQSNGDAGSGGDSDTDTDTDSDTDADSGADPLCYENLDIVFVLDVSTTMSFVLQTLENEIGIVWDKAQEIDDDPHFGLVVFVDDVTVANTDTYGSVTELQQDFHKWWTHTQSNKQTTSGKTNADFPENSLDALYAAASEYNWRDPEKTLRVIIHATDDTFREAPAKFTGSVQAQHTYPETVQALQSAYVRVAAFASFKGGPLGGANVAVGFHTEYNGQPAIPVATDGEAFNLEQVGKTISLVEAINKFVLDELCTEYAPV
ncbi:MAG: VWA domain-containing protein [Deltaproteobacteria bacterium]|nr:VWA domain-containing protein [Deltaproteobacteria bacterium]